MPTCRKCGITMPGKPDSGLCPNCGAPLESSAAPAKTAMLEPVFEFFRKVRQIHLKPSEFFAVMPVKGGIAWPLAFALICHWIGTALEFLWMNMLGFFSPERGRNFMDRLFERIGRGVEALQGTEIDSLGRNEWMDQTRDVLTQWFWSAGDVITDPFRTLVWLLITAGIVWIGARLFVTPSKSGNADEITYESAVRIIAYGSAPTLLAGFPIFGSWVAPIYVMVVTVIGAKLVYRIGTGRAIVVALFPKVLVLSGILLIFLGIFAIFMKALLLPV